MENMGFWEWLLVAIGWGDMALLTLLCLRIRDYQLERPPIRLSMGLGIGIFWFIVLPVGAIMLLDAGLQRLLPRAPPTKT